MVGEDWKDTLKERSEAVLDGVVGLVLALAAYDLMSISVAGWSQLAMLLLFSFMTLILIMFLWYIGSEALDVVPQDNQLFALNILLIVLLTTLPFSVRLSLFSDVKELGATFLAINTGILFAVTALINFLLLQRPESHTVPRSVLADIQAYVFGLPAGSLVAFLSLLAPTEAIAEGPFAGWNIPLRALSLFWSFTAFFLVVAVADVLIRRRIPASAEGIPEIQKMGGVFHSKMRTVNNTLFEAALGLSAFSLTDLPVATVAGLIPPLAYFTFLFFLIVVFWVELYRVYAAIPVWNEWLDFLTGWAPLLAIFAPPTFRLVALPSPEAKELGTMVFPIFTAIFALANAAVYLYAARFREHDVTLSRERVSEFRRWAAGSLILAFIFTASLLIPSNVMTLLDIPLRVVVWWISLAVFAIIMWVATHTPSNDKEK
ncbi:MAG: hypothetical protein ACE5OW_04295 [Candidatus Bathyarchaeia archaeon]